MKLDVLLWHLVVREVSPTGKLDVLLWHLAVREVSPHSEVRCIAVAFGC